MFDDLDCPLIHCVQFWGVLGGDKGGDKNRWPVNNRHGGDPSMGFLVIRSHSGPANIWNERTIN